LETIIVDGTKIALIVRGKTAVDHEPDLLAQHADVILGDGTPIGFFGEGDGISGSGASIGFGMDGIVYDYNLLRVHRPYYIDVGLAKKYKIKSTVLIIPVKSAEAQEFKNYWTRLNKNPGNFTLLGDNCSTHASEAFMHIGATKKGIPGLDTPDNLYKQLSTLRSNSKSYTGYIGFKKKESVNGFDLVIEQ